jgi:hypothetical protein
VEVLLSGSAIISFYRPVRLIFAVVEMRELQCSLIGLVFQDGLAYSQP